MNLTQRGIFIFSEGMRAGELAACCQHIERLGYGAVWFPEAVGREPILAASFVLQHTTRLIAATGIVNIYSRDPMACAMMQQTVAEHARGRFLLGLGVSHTLFVNMRGHDYGKPVATMQRYLDGIRASHAKIAMTTNLLVEGLADQPVTQRTDGTTVTAAGEMPIVLAALGPRMTALAGRASQGSHPANTTPEHSAKARAIMGPGPWLCPMQRVCLTRDATLARRVGRQMMALYLGLPNYLNMWRDYGFSDADFAHGGSDRLIDAMVAWGDEAALQRRVQEHLDAGASHVAIVPINPHNPSLPCWRAIEALAV
jgi:alkanesulfonate monooxygenase SsuD/methylene tetrahydromethanopterin reductase-like flavin-dependent oxidoreductase (luciferase family)